MSNCVCGGVELHVVHGVIRCRSCGAEYRVGHFPDRESTQKQEAPELPQKADSRIPDREPTAFKSILAEMEALHDKKQQDYGKDADPFANVRASEDFGIPGWHGCLIRANDKMRRLQTFCQKGTLANEGVEDSLLDLAVYSVIALVLWREKHPPEEKS